MHKSRRKFEIFIRSVNLQPPSLLCKKWRVNLVLNLVFQSQDQHNKWVKWQKPKSLTIWLSSKARNRFCQKKESSWIQPLAANATGFHNSSLSILMQLEIDNFHPSLVFAHIVQSKFKSHTDEVSGHQNNQNTSSVQLFVTYDGYETDQCATVCKPCTARSTWSVCNCVQLWKWSVCN